MSKPTKLAQSGLGVVKRDWSSTSQEPRSSQPIYWPPTPPNPVQPARKLTGSEQRLKDIQDALTGYAPVSSSCVATQVQNKRASPSGKTPPPKRARQLPPDWHSNDTLSKPSLARQQVGADKKEPIYENSTSSSSVKKIAPVFLSQEQTQILKLVQDGSSVFYTGSAGM